MAQHPDPFAKARARYAFMLGLPPTFTVASLAEAAAQYEQCRYGMDHAAWRAGYCGAERQIGPERQYQEGKSAALEDLCPVIPPGLDVADAQKDWRRFESYFEEVLAAAAPSGRLETTTKREDR